MIQVKYISATLWQKVVEKKILLFYLYSLILNHRDTNTLDKILIKYSTVMI